MKATRWCVWIRFQDDRGRWNGPWNLAATFHGCSDYSYRTGHRMAVEYARDTWTCKQQRRVLPEGREPKETT